MTPDPRDCVHGQLARSCNFCELEEIIANLEAKLRVAVAALHDIKEYSDDSCCAADDALIVIGKMP